MKVYVIYADWDYEGYGEGYGPPERVFASEEKAKAIVEKYNAEADAQLDYILDYIELEVE